MTIPLIDMRAKITPRADKVLTAHAIALDVDKSRVVRDVLDRWAAQQQKNAADIMRAMGGRPA